MYNMLKKVQADMNAADSDHGVPVSVKIRERLLSARKRFHSNDNIADFIEPGELEALLDTVKAIKDLHKGDIDAEKVGLERTKVEQAERTLVLAEDKFRRETADLILQHIKDAEVQRIAASKESNTVKMDQLILHIWGKRPDQPAAPDFKGPPP